MRGIRPPALFELRAHEWRNAVDLHHLPEGTHSLAPRPGSLVRWTFQIGPRGRICTCTLEGLSFVPLRWATRGGAHGRIRTDTGRVLSALSLRWTTWAKWCRVREFHPQPLRSERSASGSWANAALKLVHPAGLSPANSPFEAEDDHNFTTDAQMVGRLGFAPSSRRLRAGTSLSKFATLVAVCKDRDAMAELN